MSLLKIKSFVIKTLSLISNLNLKSTSSVEKEAPVCTSPIENVRKLMGRSRQASLTLEASVTIPLFVMFAVAILFLFRVLQLQQDVEAALEYAARECAISTHGESEDSWNADTLASARTLFYRQLDERDTMTQYVAQGKGGFHFGWSETEGSYVDLCVSYRICNPIAFWGLLEYPVNQRAKCHKWIGNTDSGTAEELWGYKTEEGSVYHLYADCAYLDLSIHTVPAESVEVIRNASGGKYQSCERCGDHGGEPEVFYVTDYGEAYHGSLGCSGLKRTVYVLPLAELEGYSLCSKCRSRQGGQ